MLKGGANNITITIDIVVGQELISCLGDLPDMQISTCSRSEYILINACQRVCLPAFSIKAVDSCFAIEVRLADQRR